MSDFSKRRHATQDAGSKGQPSRHLERSDTHTLPAMAVVKSNDPNQQMTEMGVVFATFLLCSRNGGQMESQTQRAAWVLVCGAVTTLVGTSW